MKKTLITFLLRKWLKIYVGFWKKWYDEDRLLSIILLIFAGIVLGVLLPIGVGAVAGAGRDVGGWAAASGILSLLNFVIVFPFLVADVNSKQDISLLVFVNSEKEIWEAKSIVCLLRAAVLNTILASGICGYLVATMGMNATMAVVVFVRLSVNPTFLVLFALATYRVARSDRTAQRVFSYWLPCASVAAASVAFDAVSIVAPSASMWRSAAVVGASSNATGWALLSFCFVVAEVVLIALTIRVLSSTLDTDRHGEESRQSSRRCGGALLLRREVRFIASNTVFLLSLGTELAAMTVMLFLSRMVVQLTADVAGWGEFAITILSVVPLLSMNSASNSVSREGSGFIQLVYLTTDLRKLFQVKYFVAVFFDCAANIAYQVTLLIVTKERFAEWSYIFVFTNIAVLSFDMIAIRLDLQRPNLAWTNAMSGMRGPSYVTSSLVKIAVVVTLVIAVYVFQSMIVLVVYGIGFAVAFVVIVVQRPFHKAVYVLTPGGTLQMLRK